MEYSPTNAAGSILPPQLIPPRVSSKLQAFQPFADAIENAKKRKARASHQLLTSTSVEEFLILKEEDNLQEARELTELYTITQRAFKTDLITQDDYRQATIEIEKQREAKTDEVLLVRKQRKLIVEDLEEISRGGGVERVQKAYGDLMAKCIAQASSRHKLDRVNQQIFSRNVMEYLHAEKLVGKDQMGRNIHERWCHVHGRWFAASVIKTAHLVPASLAGKEISYAFGVQELDFTSMRLGITLHRLVEEKLDAAELVFVPVQQYTGQKHNELGYKLVLTNPQLATLTGPDGRKWGKLDGKILKFRGPERPMKQFFYFRFLMTYLHCKNTKGWDLKWVDAIKTEGYIWATPGPYIREGMLQAIALAAGDVYEPEAFRMELARNTFIDVKGSPALDEDTVIGMSRKLSMKMAQASVREQRDRSEGDNSMDSDNGEED
jgi:hypothetical protein